MERGRRNVRSHHREALERLEQPAHRHAHRVVPVVLVAARAEQRGQVPRQQRQPQSPKDRQRAVGVCGVEGPQGAHVVHVRGDDEGGDGEGGDREELHIRAQFVSLDSICAEGEL